jgi:hypothetical protein
MAVNLAKICIIIIHLVVPVAMCKAPDPAASIRLPYLKLYNEAMCKVNTC